MEGTSLQNGRFTLISRLGEDGGMGEVWLAFMHMHDGVRQTVVLKRALAGDELLQIYFRNEALLAARLSHANIVHALDYFVAGTDHWIAYEYIEGANGLKLIEKAREALTPEAVVYIGEQAARGLHRAHTFVYQGKPANVVHRDVSPDNLYISVNGEVKVGDFGIAKVDDHVRQRTEQGFKGKGGYAPYEVIKDEGVDARADVYSLGATLYHLLTGQRPHPGSSMAAAMFVIEGGPVMPIGRLNASAPPALVAVIERAMQPRKENRFPTMDEMRIALIEAVPTFSRGEKPLAEAARRLSAANRRLTSGNIVPEELRAKLLASQGVVMPSDTNDSTMRLDADSGRTVAAKAAAKQLVSSSAHRAASAEDTTHRPAAPLAPIATLDTQPLPPSTAADDGKASKGSALKLGGVAVGSATLVVVVLALSGAFSPPVQTTPASPAPASAAASTPAPVAPAVVAAPPAEPTPAPASAPTAAAPPPSAKPTATKPPAVAAEKPAPKTTRKTEAKSAPSPSEQTEPAAAPKKSSGTIVVEATKGSPVSIDGAPIGRSPLRYPISPGVHTIEVTAGGQTLRQTRTVFAGAETLVEFTPTTAAKAK